MEKPVEDHKNVLEWVVFGIGLAAVLALLGLFTVRAFTSDSEPAEIIITYNHVPTETLPYRYHISVQNTGDQTAENVIIELTLQKDDTVLERAQMEIPYVPKSSRREGWMNFTTNPASADNIAARPVSYIAP